MAMHCCMQAVWFCNVRHASSHTWNDPTVCHLCQQKHAPNAGLHGMQEIQLLKGGLHRQMSGLYPASHPNMSLCITAGAQTGVFFVA